MEDKIREARVTLGAKTYLLCTALPAEQFDDIVTFSQKLFSSLDPKAEQEKRLLLGWMYMAYKLQQTETKLRDALEKSGALDDAATLSGEQSE